MWINPYLGRPGNMIALPPPDSADAPPSRGDSTSGLLGGGIATVRRLATKRQYTLGYDDLLPAEADLLTGFYQGAFGLGPYVYVDPTAQNVMPYDAANCGLRTYAPHGWLPGSGTLARSATGGPTGLAQTGVLTWSGYTSPNILTALSPSAVSVLPVYVPAEIVTVSVWLKASSTGTFRLTLVGYGSDGSEITSPAPPSMTLSIGTTWTQMVLTVAAGASAFVDAAFITPRITLPGSPPGSTSIAAAQIEYSPTVSAWRPGQGSPRVLIKETPGYSTPVLGYSAHTLSLGEV